jgi:hypothetical protein
MTHMKHKVSPDEYEQALSEKLLYEFPPPIFRVVWDASIPGRYSKVPRQLDVAVYREKRRKPFLVAEAKRWSRRVDVGLIDCFIGKLDDIGGEVKIGVVVSLMGFSRGAERRANASELKLLIMSGDEALEMNWRPIARQIYPWDWAFHPELVAGLLALHRGDEPSRIIDEIERIPFDEWLGFVRYGLANYPLEAVDFLRFVAQNHTDDGWRFNAVQQLIAFNSLSQPVVETILSQERDHEIVGLLRDYGFV